MLSIILTDQIPSGKNQVRDRFVNGRRVQYPNKRFTEWRQRASSELILQKRAWPTALKMALPLKGALKLTVSYREVTPVPANGTRDLTGMLDALQHLLEWSELIEDDGQIKAVNFKYPYRMDGPCMILELKEI